MTPVSRYHPLLVTLHWLLTFLIVAALAMGVWLALTPNVHPSTFTVLRWHMAGGMLILALTAIRFVVRMRSTTPDEVRAGYTAFDRIARMTHYGFYALIALIAATGLATAVLAGLNRIVFQGSGEPLPATLTSYPTFIAHIGFAIVLGGMIVVHAAAILWHQYVLKDRLLDRMSFSGTPTKTPGASQ